MIRRFVPLAALLLAVWAQPAAAAGLLLLTEENPPFNYTESGRLVGAGTEIVAQIASRAAIPVRTEVLPWDTAYVRAQAERNTCLYSTAREENREKLFLWIGPIATNQWALYARGDFAVPIRTLKDAAPYRIGVVTRDAKADFLRENGVTNLKFVRDDRDNPPRLLLPPDNPDHIDLWISGVYSAREIARAAKVADLKRVFIAAERPLYLACNPQTDRTTVKALADALEALRAEGTVERVNASYEKKFAP